MNTLPETHKRVFVILYYSLCFSPFLAQKRQNNRDTQRITPFTLGASAFLIGKMGFYGH